MKICARRATRRRPGAIRKSGVLLRWAAQHLAARLVELDQDATVRPPRLENPRLFAVARGDGANGSHGHTPSCRTTSLPRARGRGRGRGGAASSIPASRALTGEQAGEDAGESHLSRVHGLPLGGRRFHRVPPTSRIPARMRSASTSSIGSALFGSTFCCRSKARSTSAALATFLRPSTNVGNVRSALRSHHLFE